MRYWLIKSEPSVYSIEDLRADTRTDWTGVRNYQARNFMRDDMRAGDLVLFYHSNAKPSGVAGVCRVVRDGYPDTTAQDPADPYFDPKASPIEPRWYMVDVAYVDVLPRLVSLEAMKAEPELADMLVVGKSRLSVQPVSRAHFEHVLRMARR